MTRNRETNHMRLVERSIGMWGTLARLAIGTVLLAVAFVVGVGWDDVAIGLVGFPAAVMLALTSRGRSATPLRFYGSRGHLINGAIVVAAFPGGAALLWRLHAACGHARLCANKRPPEPSLARP